MAIAAAVSAGVVIAAAIAGLGDRLDRPVVAAVLALALIGANLAPLLSIRSGRVDAFTPVGALLVPIGLLLPLPEAVLVYALGEGIGVLAAHRLDERVGGPGDDPVERNLFVIGKSILGAALGLLALRFVAGAEPGVLAQVAAAFAGVAVSTAFDHTAVAATTAAVGAGSFGAELRRGAADLAVIGGGEVVAGALIAVLAGRDPWSLVLGLVVLTLLMVAGTAYTRASADRSETTALLGLAEELQSAGSVADVEAALLLTVRGLLPDDDAEVLGAEPGEEHRGWRLTGDPAPRWLVVRRIVDTRDYQEQPLAVVDAAVSLARVAITRAVAQQQLVAQDQLRSLVLTTVAHDLRGPLAVAKASIELLDSSPQEQLDDTGVRLMGASRRGVARLERLIDDLLELEQVEAAAGPSGAAAEVTPVVADLLEELDAGDVRLEVLGDPGTAALSPVALGRVLENLLANARKYSPPGGPVVVRCAPGEGGGSVLAVIDGGPGVPHDERELIFEPFEQAGRERGGVGLGLFVARRFVERHGGRIWVEDAPGGGAAFHVWLPSAEPRAQPEAPTRTSVDTG